MLRVASPDSRALTLPSKVNPHHTPCIQSSVPGPAHDSVRAKLDLQPTNTEIQEIPYRSVFAGFYWSPPGWLETHLLLREKHA